MRLHGFLAFIFIGQILYPRGAISRIASVKTASFGPAGNFCGHHMRQDKTNTAANGVQRRQTRAGVPKKQFSASKRKKMRRRHFRILSDFSLFIGLSAFTDFIQV
jgi:hypothetical protein